ncbi:class E sortase [Streptomyces sp. NPDC058611]|uniref:class E sortase n=1 Tax=unclassified Streptomyces TaxID=2593676 RepID=UPI003667FCB1
MRDHIPVVVQGRARREPRVPRVAFARVLWVCAEVVTTVGVVVALLVVHQVWWTNRQAVAAAQDRVRALEREWGSAPAEAAVPAAPAEAAVPAVPGETGEPGEPGEADGSVPPGGDSEPVSPGGPTGVPSAPASRAPAPAAGAPAAGGPAYAVLRVPRLGLSVPVARGVDKRTVLDKGYAGQYPGTAAPGARGNFALAGHRNTHGEPFRYLNRLRPGDELLVDVRGRRYTYVVGKVLGETTERDTGVIAPVPRSVVKPEYGYSEPGAYITLTTCTPEYTSRYRLVVWGTLRP